MEPRWKRRFHRVRDHRPIEELLDHYGYPVYVAGGIEQQFPCDLHGDGNDGTPSARVYPDTNSFYCFACDAVRDAVELARIKENLTFMGAVKFLEERYNLPTLPWEDGDSDYQDTEKPEDEIARIFDTKGISFDQARGQLEALLQSLFQEQSLGRKKLLTLWEVFDQMTWYVTKKLWTENQGTKSMLKVKQRILDTLKDV